VASEGAIRSWTRAGLIEKGILARAGQPIDIANGILFLATDSSRFVNGETIAFSGNPA
jgi:NAD(P)-dependent dehydrogenase (short-subunit alcohol dehydrogenase family)